MGEQLSALRTGIEASIAAKRKLLADDDLLNRIVTVGGLMTKPSSVETVSSSPATAAAPPMHSIWPPSSSAASSSTGGLPSLSLATDSSMITPIGNDYGYHKLFRRQLEAQARKGDLFVGITTSGRSKNVLEAFRACPALEVTSVALCGTGGDLDGVDHVLRAPSGHTPRIQECHILIGHMLCAQVELALFAHLKPR